MTELRLGMRTARTWKKRVVEQTVRKRSRLRTPGKSEEAADLRTMEVVVRAPTGEGVMECTEILTRRFAVSPARLTRRTEPSLDGGTEVEQRQVLNPPIASGESMECPEHGVDNESMTSSS